MHLEFNNDFDGSMSANEIAVSSLCGSSISGTHMVPYFDSSQNYK